MLPRPFLLAVVLGGTLPGVAVCADLPRAAAPAFQIAVHGERLTVALERAPMGRVLAELARQAGIRVDFPPSMQNDAVWASFEDMPLEQGISRLLAGYSFAIFHGSASTMPGAPVHYSVMQLVVLPKDERVGSPQQSSALLETNPRNAVFPKQSPQQHEVAALDTLTQAMVDPDENVRAHAQAMFEQALTQAGATTAQKPEARR